MTNFTDFNLVFDNLATYFAGDYTTLALSCLLLFLVVLLVAGLDFRYASLFTLPLAGFFVFIGWFGSIGDSQWIVNIGLIIVSFGYALAILRLTN